MSSAPKGNPLASRNLLTASIADVPAALQPVAEAVLTHSHTAVEVHEPAICIEVLGVNAAPKPMETFFWLHKVLAKRWPLPVGELFTLQGDTQLIPWDPPHAWHGVAGPSQRSFDDFDGTRSDASHTAGLLPEQGSVLMMTWPLGRHEELGEPVACTPFEPCVRTLLLEVENDTAAILALAHGEELIILIGQEVG